MDKESISDAENVTADTFSHTSNTQIDNANAIFTSEKLDKSDELADKLKDLTINDAQYYVSNSATANDAKGDPASDPKTVTHTSDGKGKVMDTINGNSQQKILSNRTLPVVVPTMNLRIDNRIVPIVGDFQTLFTPATKEVVADAECSSTWVDWTPRQLILTGVDGSTPGNTGLDLRSKSSPSQVLIGSLTIYPACGLSGSLQVRKKRQSTSPNKVSNAQKLDTVVDVKLINDRDSASFFSKVIVCKLSHQSNNDLYSCCRIKFSSNVVQTEAPQLVDLGLPAINTLNESGVLGNPDTRI